MIKKVVVIIGILLGIIILVLGLYLGYLTLKDYKPDPIEALNVENNSEALIEENEELTVMTYNIGFGGMDEEVHFFMDGGSMSRGISEDKVNYNIDEVVKLLEESQSDIMMIQEVDLDSTRSFNVNQYESLKRGLKEYGATYGINYDVHWIAYPIVEPHGKVVASQVNLANRFMASSDRIALPIDEKWPQRLVGLDRMMLVNRFPVSNGKELVAINVHLSAYDKGGKIRKLQLDLVSEVLEEEYSKGNYVIIGGDWNQAIPGSDASIFDTEEEWPDWLVEIPETFAPKGFTWVFDGNIPTCRNAGKEYIEGYNFLSVIDGFMISDNIELIDVQGIDTKFKYSDHNPVEMKIKLK